MRCCHSTLAIVLTCSASLFGATACQTNPAPRPGLADPYPPPMNDPDISVVDLDLQQWLAFHPAVRVKMAGRPLQVEVPARNLADNAFIVEYRFLFFDENGLQEEPIMGWKMQAIDPKQTAQLKGSSYDSSARRYKLEVRWSR